MLSFYHFFQVHFDGQFIVVNPFLRDTLVFPRLFIFGNLHTTFQKNRFSTFESLSLLSVQPSESVMISHYIIYTIILIKIEQFKIVSLYISKKSFSLGHLLRKFRSQQITYLTNNLLLHFFIFL